MGLLWLCEVVYGKASSEWQDYVRQGSVRFGVLMPGGVG